MQVTPDHPEDLCIIVDDLRAFMSSNIPASITEMFPQTIETLLIDYVKALGPQHAVVRCRLPCQQSAACCFTSAIRALPGILGDAC